ncbi:hypothetical protein FRC10_001461 [Ceratobasidium sp. 414]|nr:hypothetical protein FRC10_001461 [Ceratobasidium sp. 414]
MAFLASTMTIWATAVLAAPPPSPGVCQPLASLSFTYPPTTIAGVSAQVIYKNLSGPRGMRFDANQNLLVVERNKQISALTFRNDSTCVGWEKRVVVLNTAIQHGIEIGPGAGTNQYLYASSAENVFRWEYNPATATVVGSPLTIAWNMTNVGAPSGEPPVGGVSRSLIVSRGSAGNADDAAGK